MSGDKVINYLIVC